MSIRATQSVAHHAPLRITVDLPPAAHRRARELAASRGVSLSAVIADLTVRGLAQTDAEVVLGTDERTGFPALSLGRERAALADITPPPPPPTRPMTDG